jgi:hypothetical protein
MGPKHRNSSQYDPSEDLENNFVCFLSEKGSFQAQKSDFKIKSLANFFSDPS